MYTVLYLVIKMHIGKVYNVYAVLENKPVVIKKHAF